MGGVWRISICVVCLGICFNVTGLETRHCEVGWRLHKDQCFSAIPTPLAWSDAASYCRSRDAQLAGINSKETQRFIEGMVRHTGQDYWLGLHYINNQGWLWVDSGHQVLSYRNWVTLKRNVASVYRGMCGRMIGRQSLARIRGSAKSSPRIGMWIQTECSRSMGFVCQKPPDLYRRVCPQGWYLYGDSCYNGYQIPMTWIMARQACKHFNGDLATIRSNVMQRFVNSLIAMRQDNYWVGLSYNRKESKWCWLDASSEAQYTNWAPSLPDSSRVDYGEQCMYVIGRHSVWTGNSETVLLGMWNHGICERQQMFICMKPADVVKVGGLPASKDVTIKNPPLNPDVSVNQDVTVKQNITSIHNTGSDANLFQDNALTDEIFSVVNVPVSLVVIATIVTAGVLIAFLYIKRPKCPCSVDMKQSDDQCNDLETSEGDYATISEIIDTVTSNSKPVTIVHLVPCGSEERSIPKVVTRTVSSESDKSLKDKHDAVVCELKRQNCVSSSNVIQKQYTRTISLESNTTACYTEGNRTEVESHSYLDLSEQQSCRTEDPHINRCVSNKESSVQPGNSDNTKDVSLSVKRGPNVQEVETNLNIRQCTDGICSEEPVKMLVSDDGYEKPVRSEGDMYLDLREGEVEGESEGGWGSEFESELEGEGCYHEYEEPVR